MELTTAKYKTVGGSDVEIVYIAPSGEYPAIGVRWEQVGATELSRVPVPYCWSRTGKFGGDPRSPSDNPKADIVVEAQYSESDIKAQELWSELADAIQKKDQSEVNRINVELQNLRGSGPGPQKQVHIIQQPKQNDW